MAVAAAPSEAGYVYVIDHRAPSAEQKHRTPRETPRIRPQYIAGVGYVDRLRRSTVVVPNLLLVKRYGSFRSERPQKSEAYVHPRTSVQQALRPLLKTRME